MIYLAVFIGLLATAVLIGTGYQFGLNRGTASGQEAHAALVDRNNELRGQLSVLSRSLHDQESTRRLLESKLGAYLREASEGSQDLQRLRREIQLMVGPSTAQDQASNQLRKAVHDVLGPLVQPERLGHELAQLELGSGKRQQLPDLLDRIASSGGFSLVLLSDDAGLPLAVSGTAANPERITGVASLLMGLFERLTRDGEPRPQAIAVHNERNQVTLSRLLEVSGQRLMLTAVTSGTSVSLVSLDPALIKLETVLAPTG